MRFLVLQHLSVEHPGVLCDFWKEAGIAWDVVELDAGESIPADLTRYDALVTMGGPMDVWQEDVYPWLRTEKEAIRRWAVALKRPFLGICLGHQLLAEAIGGSVGPMERPEVGVVRMSCTAAGLRDPLFSESPRVFSCFQWHGAEVKSLPREAEVLATNPACRFQAFRWGRHAYGIQYHVELTQSTVTDWGSVPAYKVSLEAALGPGALERLQQDVTARLGEFNGAARRLNEHFVRMVENRVSKAEAWLWYLAT